MISFGYNVRDNTSKLEKVPVEKIYKAILNPKEKIKQQINTLRHILTIDEHKYRKLKTQLPYICSSIFNPPIRKNINFAYTQYFILDIDHLQEKEINIDSLKEKLKKDNRIVMIFNSPSNDGLKLLFRLQKKCYDAGKYALFYKLFAEQFSRQYNIVQVVDTRTSDVSRACFVSYDPKAYYNPNAEPVVVRKYIDFDNDLEVETTRLHFEKLSRKNKKTEPQKIENVIPDDIFAEIKQKLSNKPKLKKTEKIIFVPEELETILDDVKNELEEYKIEIEQITNIHYGKKIRLKHQTVWAEVNIFYGKKGFSVVKTPKRGSNLELADLAVEIINNFLHR